MKKKYATPKVEMMEFDYSDTITASHGNAYQLYVDKHGGCQDTPTDRWFVMENDNTESCMKEIFY